MLHTAIAWVGFLTQVGLGMMYLWSAASMAWEWSLFRSTVEGLGLARAVASPAAGTLIAAEFSLGSLLATGEYPAPTAAGALLLLLFFAGIGLYAEGRGLNLSCNCFGGSRTRLGKVTSVRAVVLAIPVMAFWLSSRSGPQTWPADSGPAVVTLVLCAWLIVHIHAQTMRAWSAP